MSISHGLIPFIVRSKTPLDPRPINDSQELVTFRLWAGWGISEKVKYPSDEHNDRADDTTQRHQQGLKCAQILIGAQTSGGSDDGYKTAQERTRRRKVLQQIGGRLLFEFCHKNLVREVRFYARCFTIMNAILIGKSHCRWLT